MDILTHALSGIAVGTVLSSFSRKGIREKLRIIGLSGFGAILPDLDVISLWSGFDATFGKLFKLEHSGHEIYFSKLWYSHHAFLHSLIAGLSLSILLAFTFFIRRNTIKSLSLKSFYKVLIAKHLVLLAFLFGFIVHLLEDMPTPHSVWGGVNFFWPLSRYTGGTGKIWWWNNYDVFLLVSGVIVLNILFIFINNFFKLRLKLISSCILFLGVGCVLLQINTRPYDFNYTRHTPKFQEYELKSSEIQQEILGDNLYHFMVKVDQVIPVAF